MNNNKNNFTRARFCSQVPSPIPYSSQIYYIHHIKCRRKRKVDNYNHGNNLIGTGGGTSGNGDSCDLFNCCMLGLTIMM